MRVDVLLFGPLAQRLGRDSVPVEIAGDAATAGQVRAALGRAEPELAGDLTACRLAVNHAFAHEATQIRSGDEVAVIGFVSGG